MQYLLLLCLVLILAISCVAEIILCIVKKSSKKTIKITISSIILCLCIAISFFLASMSHGASLNTIMTHDPHETFIHWKNTPVDESERVKILEENDTLNKTVLIFYRFDCNDCTNTYHDIQNLINSTDTLYYQRELGLICWVNSRSEKGKELVKEYNIQEVPSMLLVYDDGVIINCSEKDENDNSIISNDLENFLLFGVKPTV